MAGTTSATQVARALGITPSATTQTPAAGAVAEARGLKGLTEPSTSHWVLNQLERFGDIRVTPPSIPERRLVTTADLKDDLGDLINAIENHYGPLPMKMQSIGLDWQRHKAEAMAKVEQITNTRDYYFLVADFLAKLNDAHVSISLPSSLRISLPLQMSAAEGKIVVNFVSDAYPDDRVRPELGDELVAINGEEPQAYRARFPHFDSNGNDRTNLALFARQLTSLSEAHGISLSDFPRDVSFRFKRANGSTYDVALTYKQSGTGLVGRPVDGNASLMPPAPRNANLPKSKPPRSELAASAPTPAAPAAPTSKDPRFDVSTLAGYAQLTPEEQARLQKACGLAERFSALLDGHVNVPGAPDSRTGLGQPMAMGRREPFYKLPDDFQEIAAPQALNWMLNPESFFAGVFERDGKRVGLLRIPSYSAEKVATLPLAINFFIGLLDKHTDELIVDQMDNPGGMVVFSDLLLKALVGDLDDEKHMRFALKPSQRFMRTLVDIKDTLESGEADELFSPEERDELLADIKENIEVVTDAHTRGLALTKPISLLPQTKFIAAALKAGLEPLRMRKGDDLREALGVDIFADQTYGHDKKVSFVINELDFSGGDATPAGFQDYGRGNLVGARTAGAGGTVESFEQRETVEYGYSLTTSLMVRCGGQYVENYGVTHNVPFEITVDDYRNGHVKFFDRLLETLGYSAQRRGRTRSR